MGTFGHYAGKLRRAASDFQRQFNEAMRETEIAEVKQAMEAVRAETESLDKPVMLPKLDTPPPTPTPPIPEASAPPAAAPAPSPAATAAPAPAAVAEAATKPKPPRKSAGSIKPKSVGTKRKKQAEPPHDA
jgi:sec-independent protein translocase protein TatB